MNRETAPFWGILLYVFLAYWFAPMMMWFPMPGLWFGPARWEWPVAFLVMIGLLWVVDRFGQRSLQ